MTLTFVLLCDYCLTLMWVWYQNLASDPMTLVTSSLMMVSLEVKHHLSHHLLFLGCRLLVLWSQTAYQTKAVEYCYQILLFSSLSRSETKANNLFKNVKLPLVPLLDGLLLWICHLFHQPHIEPTCQVFHPPMKCFASRKDIYFFSFEE